MGSARRWVGMPSGAGANRSEACRLLVVSAHGDTLAVPAHGHLQFGSRWNKLNSPLIGRSILPLSGKSIKKIDEALPALTDIRAVSATTHPISMTIAGR